jgi:hypothetical protein
MPTKKTHTYQLQDGEYVTPSKLSKLGKSKQIWAMRMWFGENFSDPNILPYNSAEGGFQWIWGGPYDAREELEDEFSGIVKDSAIEELAHELERENWEWSGNPDEYEPDDEDFYNYAHSRMLPSAVLELSLNQIEEAAKHKSLGEIEQFIHRLLFANAITALETYLAEKFRKTIDTDPALIQKFVETFPGLRERRVSLSAVTAVARNLEKLVMSELSKVMWHRLDKVGKMYNDTLSVPFPDDLKLLEKAIKDRHDIVHRNGKSEDGTIGSWDETSIIELVRSVRQLAAHIEIKLPPPDPIPPVGPEL